MGDTARRRDPARAWWPHAVPASFEDQLAVVAELLREVERMEAGEKRHVAGVPADGYEGVLAYVARRFFRGRWRANCPNCVSSGMWCGIFTRRALKRPGYGRTCGASFERLDRSILKSGHSPRVCLLRAGPGAGSRGVRELSR